MPNISAAQPSRVSVLAALFAVYLIWGSTYLAIRFAVVAIPPFLMVGVRFLIAGAALYVWTRARGAPRPTWTNIRAAAIIGAFLLVGGNGIVAWAESQGVPSGLTALLVSMTPIWMALLDWLRPRGTRPTWIVACGLLIGFGGVALLIGPNLFKDLHSGNPWALIVIPFASLSWATGSIYARRAPTPASPLMGSGLEMFAAGVMLTLIGLVTGEVGQVHLQSITLQASLSLVYLIIFGSLVGYSAYVWLLKSAPLTLVSTYAYVNPVVAVFLGWALAGELLTPFTLVAAAVIVLAVGLITTFRDRPIKAREPVPVTQRA